MDVAFYQQQVYRHPPCWELTTDVLLRELDIVVSKYRARSSRLPDIANAFRLELARGDHGFTQLQVPQDFAVTLMGKDDTVGVHHCGVFYQGRVLHALATGIYYQDLASLGDEFKLMEFWAHG